MKLWEPSPQTTITAQDAKEDERRERKSERDEDRAHIDCSSCSDKPTKMKNAKPHQPNDIKDGVAMGPFCYLWIFCFKMLLCFITRWNLGEISVYLSLIDLWAAVCWCYFKDIENDLAIYSV